MNGTKSDVTEHTYECENCGAVFNTILPSWPKPRCCYECGTRRPWRKV